MLFISSFLQDNYAKKSEVQIWNRFSASSVTYKIPLFGSHTHSFHVHYRLHILVYLPPQCYTHIANAIYLSLIQLSSVLCRNLIILDLEKYQSYYKHKECWYYANNSVSDSFGHKILSSVLMHLPYLALTVSECCLLIQRKYWQIWFSRQHVGGTKVPKRSKIYKYTLKGN